MAARQLESTRIVETIDLLCRRIRERFPSAGLNNVCEDLLGVARQARQRSIQIGRPMLGIRILSATIIALIVTTFVFAVMLIKIPAQTLQAAELVEVIEAACNTVLLVGAVVLFFVTLEVRVKRHRALQALHELRSIAHIIDMHQLTKDPERIVGKGSDTESSPRRTMSQFELNRYLDYCSEMLSLTGKIAALYVEKFPDAQAVAAVNDIEDLTSGLARKIWQKIVILHSDPAAAAPTPAAVASVPAQGAAVPPVIS
nr:hypothetical protein [Planctomicrobium piriforme]